jgi:hypothetical protein
MSCFCTSTLASIVRTRISHGSFFDQLIISKSGDALYDPEHCQAADGVSRVTCVLPTHWRWNT